MNAFIHGGALSDPIELNPNLARIFQEKSKEVGVCIWYNERDEREKTTKEEDNQMPDINILVVDDEKEIADLIEIYLVSDGYKVFKAENAEAGLSILDKQDIHLVLLDIMMPGMN